MSKKQETTTLERSQIYNTRYARSSLHTIEIPYTLRKNEFLGATLSQQVPWEGMLTLSLKKD